MAATGGLVAGLLVALLASLLIGPVAWLALLAGPATAAGWAWRHPAGLPPPAPGWTGARSDETSVEEVLHDAGQRGWTVLTDVTVPGTKAHLPYLLVGAAGVVELTTQHWSAPASAIRWDGRDLWFGRVAQTPTIKTLAWEAGQAGDRISRAHRSLVPVLPVLAVHGTQLPQAALYVDDVLVVRVTELGRLLAHLGASYPQEEVAGLVTAVRDALPPYQPPSSAGMAG